MPRAFRRRVLDSEFGWSAIAGTALAALAFLTAYATTRVPLVAPLVDDLGLGALAFSGLAALSAFLPASSGWWFVVERPGRVTRERGALVGLLTGLLAHPVTWLLSAAYLDLRAGRVPLEDGSVPFVALFLHFGLAITGTYTVVVGVCGGLSVALLRERTGPDVGEDRRNLFVVAVPYVVAGFLVVVVALATSLFFPVLVVAGLLAAGASALSFRQFPVVQTFLRERFRSVTGESPPVLHVAVGFGFELVFVVGGIVAYALASPVDNFYWYPVAFVAIALPVALAANYRWSGWEPPPSARRAVVEWSVYLCVVTAVLTATFAVYLVAVLPGLY